MPLIEVQSGDSGGISVTGKPPARAAFSRPGGEKDCPLSFRTYPHAPRNGKAKMERGNRSLIVHSEWKSTWLICRFEKRKY